MRHASITANLMAAGVVCVVSLGWRPARADRPWHPRPGERGGRGAAARPSGPRVPLTIEIGAHGRVRVSQDNLHSRPLKDIPQNQVEVEYQPRGSRAPAEVSTSHSGSSSAQAGAVPRTHALVPMSQAQPLALMHQALRSVGESKPMQVTPATKLPSLTALTAQSPFLALPAPPPAVVPAKPRLVEAAAVEAGRPRKAVALLTGPATSVVSSAKPAVAAMPAPSKVLLLTGPKQEAQAAKPPQLQAVLALPAPKQVTVPAVARSRKVQPAVPARPEVIALSGPKAVEPAAAKPVVAKPVVVAAATTESKAGQGSVAPPRGDSGPPSPRRRVNRRWRTQETRATASSTGRPASPAGPGELQPGVATAGHRRRRPAAAAQGQDPPRPVLATAAETRRPADVVSIDAARKNRQDPVGKKPVESRPGRAPSGSRSSQRAVANPAPPPRRNQGVVVASAVQGRSGTTTGSPLAGGSAAAAGLPSPAAGTTNVMVATAATTNATSGGSIASGGSPAAQPAAPAQSESQGQLAGTETSSTSVVTYTLMLRVAWGGAPGGRESASGGQSRRVDQPAADTVGDRSSQAIGGASAGGDYGSATVVADLPSLSERVSALPRKHLRRVRRQAERLAGKMIVSPHAAVTELPTKVASGR